VLAKKPALARVTMHFIKHDLRRFSNMNNPIAVSAFRDPPDRNRKRLPGR